MFFIQSSDSKIFNKSFVLKFTLAIRLILAAGKLTAFFFTGFLFLLGEALNNITDIVVVVFTFLGVKIGKKGGDREHPFGYRRMENIVALIVAVVFISVTSFQLLKTSVPLLFSPPELTGNPRLALYVLIASFGLNMLPLPLLFKARKQDDVSLKTMLFDTINDGLSLSASMVGLALIYMGLSLGDPIATVVIALIIAFDAVMLIRENLHVLLGQSPEDEVFEEIERIVLDHEEVLGIHDMIGEYIGPEVIHMDFDMELDPETSLENSDQVVKDVKEKLGEDFSKDIVVSIHPCSHKGSDRRIYPDL